MVEVLQFYFYSVLFIEFIILTGIFIFIADLGSNYHQEYSEEYKINKISMAELTIKEIIIIMLITPFYPILLPLTFIAIIIAYCVLGLNNFYKGIILLWGKC
jgi:ABC-type transport system involved in cytochrome bd biosynthesis fused ATPase/permease subunit